ncbi:hypothetical protein AAL_06461 [Moelleriella libera RCEF 2490]|uniref:Heat-labile enterotoxin, A chain n=1 Tax=Moelleriella libera RCEF 2490 TaxID=1081109 RepID=A0A167YSG9_9HYPO|nr:hypothetical protein AAL_06461 [Moelleriella libera RCEF 2490]
MLLVQPLVVLVATINAASASQVQEIAALERLFYYFAYRLDHITTTAHSRRTIVPSWSTHSSEPKTLDEFLDFVHPDARAPFHVSADDLPNIDESVKTIGHLELDHIGPLSSDRLHNHSVSHDSESSLFEKLGNVIKDKMGVTTKDSHLGKDTSMELRKLKRMTFDSLNRLYKSHVETSYNTFEQEFPKVFQAKYPQRHLSSQPLTMVREKGGMRPNFEETLKLNYQPLSTEELESLWDVSTAEGHDAVLEAMLDDAEDAWMETVRETFQPFDEPIECVEGRDLGIDLDATIRKNPQVSTTNEQLWALWLEHLNTEQVVPLEKSKQLVDRFEAARKAFEADSGRSVVLDGYLSIDFAASMAGNGTTDANEMASAWNDHLEKRFPPSFDGNHDNQISSLHARAGNSGGFCDVLKKKLFTDSKPMTPAQLSKLAKAAEEVSDTEFAKLSGERGLEKWVQDRWKSPSLSKARAKLTYSDAGGLLKYEPLSVKSLRVKKIGSALSKVGSGAASGIGIGLWAKEMYDVFSTNSTTLDRVATSTALIPFVGCATRLAADADRGQIDAVDASLCLMTDVLLLTPLAPLAIAVSIFRLELSVFVPREPEKIISIGEAEIARAKGWEAILDQHVFAKLANSTRERLQDVTAMETLNGLSEGAQQIGLLTAMWDVASGANSGSGSNVPQEERDALEEAIADIRASMDAHIVTTQRRTLIDVPIRLTNDTFNERFIGDAINEPHAEDNAMELSIPKLGEQFARYFVDTVASKVAIENAEKNEGFGLSPAPAPKVPPNSQGLAKGGALRRLRAHLNREKLWLPNAYEVAYVFGQSGDFSALAENVISPEDYLRDLAEADVSADDIRVVFQDRAFAVSMVLRRRLTDQQMTSRTMTVGGKTLSPEDTLRFDVLTAIKFGQRFAQLKKDWAARRFVGPKAGLLNVPGIKEWLTGYPDLVHRVLEPPDDQERRRIELNRQLLLNDKPREDVLFVMQNEGARLNTPRMMTFVAQIRKTEEDYQKDSAENEDFFDGLMFNMDR